MEEIDPNAPVLETKAVQVLSSWNECVQITGVDWKVMPGESWVIGGRHGSGKTDLLMTVAGLHQPATGSVRLFGRETSRLSEEELLRQRSRVGIVFKDGGRMFNELTVAENVALPLCYHRNWTLEQASKEVHEILEATQLTDLAQETAQRLGAAWRQRVGLARALALKPQILFLDEPTASLDADHHQWSQTHLAQLVSQKITVIATTYDFALWSGGSHHFAVIKDKQWQLLGERTDAPQNDFQTQFITK